MIISAFVLIILGAAVVAVLAQNMRTSALALWVASLGVGTIYLTVGAETLAVIQWIVSTLVAISFTFFAAMFDGKESFSLGQGAGRGRRISMLALAAVVGLCFVALVYFGWASTPTGPMEAPLKNNDLLALGQLMTEKHLLSLETLGVTLFVVLVGGGVIARPEAADEDEKETDPC
ncbi:MAG: NADH-quinone oxidoreductase subunit J [Oligoflexia bacterium]|nr:NADH-quinone oxidoreductase subunit J [Oligoflexia bacterium]